MVQDTLLATQTLIGLSFPTIFREDSWIGEDRQHKATRFGDGRGPEWRDGSAEGRTEVTLFYSGFSLVLGIASVRFPGLEVCLCLSGGGGHSQGGNPGDR